MARCARHLLGEGALTDAQATQTPFATITMPVHQRRAIRSQIRLRRRALSDTERRIAAAQLTQALCRNRAFRAAEHIAMYLAHDGEINLQPLIECAWRLNKQVWLPQLKRSGMRFVRYHRTSSLHYNRFRIKEPRVARGEWVQGHALSLILMPLTAFDSLGNRLGMGGGYYDKAFAFLKQRQFRIKPKLIGVAFDFQQLPEIKHQPWDVPMNAIATPSGVRYFKCSKRHANP